MIALGFEPRTACLEGRCSIQLSYATNTNFKVGVAGFEPAASTSQTWRDNRATLHPVTFNCSKRNSLSSHYCRINKVLNYCGETGIRTLGKCFHLRRFSKPLLSATQAPLQFLMNLHTFFKCDCKCNFSS